MAEDSKKLTVDGIFDEVSARKDESARKAKQVREAQVAEALKFADAVKKSVLTAWGDLVAQLRAKGLEANVTLQGPGLADDNYSYPTATLTIKGGDIGAIPFVVAYTCTPADGYGESARMHIKARVQRPLTSRNDSVDEAVNLAGLTEDSVREYVLRHLRETLLERSKR